MFIIELPDQYGNLAFPGPCVVECEAQPSEMLPDQVRLIAPDEIASKWSTLLRGKNWIEIPDHGPARSLTDAEYVMLLMEVKDRVTPWRLEGALRRAEASSDVAVESK